MPVALSLLLVLFFLLMNAFFVAAEFSLVRIRKSQAEVLQSSGERGAGYTLMVASNVNAYLGACQLGITLASLALGWLGEPAVSQLIHPVLSLLGLPDAAISAIALAIGFIIITALHIVVGELIPKSLAIFSTEKYALLTAAPLVWFYRITYPVMWLFNSITNGVMKLLGHEDTQVQEAYTGEEIQLLIDESTKSGELTPEQDTYLDNIFDMGDKDAEAIMTPRTELICVDIDASFEENLNVMQQYKYTRYPVYRDNKDNILGFVHIKDLYDVPTASPMTELRIRPIRAVPVSMMVARVLQMLQKSKTKIAVVVDEHGGTAGIVTMSDIMTQIIGSVEDEYYHDDTDKVIRITDSHYVIGGSLPLDDLAEIIGFMPDETADSETTAGLMFSLFEKIPSAGDEAIIEHEGTRVTFVIENMDAHRVDTIDLTIAHAQEQDE
ncbi:MAG: hemolysin family protein [Coriobacteriales bacterium]|nr:hemolysin family protein [Coriobacteriales bacterium]